MPEQRVYSYREFVSERELRRGFAVVRGKSDEKEEIWTARELLLCR